MSSKGPVIQKVRLPGGGEFTSIRPDVFERACSRANLQIQRCVAENADRMSLTNLLKRIDAKASKNPTAKTHWVLVSPDDREALARLLQQGVAS